MVSGGIGGEGDSETAAGVVGICCTPLNPTKASLLPPLFASVVVPAYQT